MSGDLLLDFRGGVIVFVYRILDVEVVVAKKKQSLVINIDGMAEQQQPLVTVVVVAPLVLQSNNTTNCNSI